MKKVAFILLILFNGAWAMKEDLKDLAKFNPETVRPETHCFTCCEQVIKKDKKNDEQKICYSHVIFLSHNANMCLNCFDKLPPKQNAIFLQRSTSSLRSISLRVLNLLFEFDLHEARSRRTIHSRHQKTPCPFCRKNLPRYLLDKSTDIQRYEITCCSDILLPFNKKAPSPCLALSAIVVGCSLLTMFLSLQ